MTNDQMNSIVAAMDAATANGMNATRSAARKNRDAIENGTRNIMGTVCADGRKTRTAVENGARNTMGAVRAANADGKRHTTNEANRVISALGGISVIGIVIAIIAAIAVGVAFHIFMASNCWYFSYDNAGNYVGVNNAMLMLHSSIVGILAGVISYSVADIIRTVTRG